MLCYSGNDRFALCDEAIREYKAAYKVEKKAFYKQYNTTVRQAYTSAIALAASRKATVSNLESCSNNDDDRGRGGSSSSGGGSSSSGGHPPKSKQKEEKEKKKKKKRVREKKKKEGKRKRERLANSNDAADADDADRLAQAAKGKVVKAAPAKTSGKKHLSKKLRA